MGPQNLKRDDLILITHSGASESKWQGYPHSPAVEHKSIIYALSVYKHPGRDAPRNTRWCIASVPRSISTLQCNAPGGPIYLGWLTLRKMIIKCRSFKCSDSTSQPLFWPRVRFLQMVTGGQGGGGFSPTVTSTQDNLPTLASCLPPYDATPSCRRSLEEKKVVNWGSQIACVFFFLPLLCPEMWIWICQRAIQHGRTQSGRREQMFIVLHQL